MRYLPAAARVLGLVAAGAADAQRIDGARDFRVPVANAPGPRVCPNSSFTCLLLYQSRKD